MASCLTIKLFPSVLKIIKSGSIMTSNQNQFSLLISRWPIILCISLILIGIFFAVSVEKPSLIVKLVIAGITEIGFAFFISYIIIITVDKREKEDFLQLMQDSRDKLEAEKRVSERRISKKDLLITPS